MPLTQKKLILHIGCEKTGTKSIQKALFKGRKQLQEQGIIFPRSLGVSNHIKLVAALQDDGVLDNILAHILSPQGVCLNTFRQNLADQFRYELSKCEPWHTIIVSSELIHSRLITPTEIGRLFNFFKEYVSEVEIILYLRRQDDLAVSRFSTALRAGHREFYDVFGNIGDFAYHQLPEGRIIDDFKDYYDYRALIKRFEKHVKKENIKITLYPDMLMNSCSIDKFTELAGIEPGLLLPNVKNLNTAMSAEAQYVITKVNQTIKRHFPSGLLRDDVKDLHNKIELEMSGDRRIVDSKDREAFLEKFSDSNEWVRVNFFPERPELFKMELPDNPDAVDYSCFSNTLKERVNYYVSQANTLPKNEALTCRLKRSINKIIYKHAVIYIPLEKIIGKAKRVAGKASRVFANTLLGVLRDNYYTINQKFTLVKNNTWKNNGNELIRDGVSSKYLLVRILGNDLYPRHHNRQTPNNLEFILKHEPNFKGSRKCFILNRIIDNEREDELIELLEAHSVDYIRIPFESDKYAATGWRVDDFGGVDYFSSNAFLDKSANEQKQIKVWSLSPKVCYAMNINGARNVAIDEGKRTADWTFVLDGNCIFSKNDFELLRADCERKPYAPYIIIPFSRLAHNKEYLNDLVQDNYHLEEPQIGFSSNATEYFNEQLPYGILDKAELLKRLGVPGMWNNWDNNKPWIKDCLWVSNDKYYFKISNSTVYRLSSRDNDSSEKHKRSTRYSTRLDSIIGTIKHLTDMYGTQDEIYSKIIR